MFAAGASSKKVVGNAIRDFGAAAAAPPAASAAHWSQRAGAEPAAIGGGSRPSIKQHASERTSDGVSAPLSAASASAVSA